MLRRMHLLFSSSREAVAMAAKINETCQFATASVVVATVTVKLHQRQGAYEVSHVLRRWERDHRTR